MPCVTFVATLEFAPIAIALLVLVNAEPDSAFAFLPIVILSSLKD